MNKKTYILSFLLLAYSVMLAHDFIPHQHKESRSEIVHQHDQEHPHQHSESEDGMDDPTFPAFHVHNFGNGTTEEYINHSANACFVKINKSSLIIAILNNINFSSTEVPKPRHPGLLGLLVLSDQFQSSFTLRGPPILII